MDQPCSYEDFRDCLRDLATSNRLTLTHRSTLRLLDQLVERDSTAQLHIVDVGCGGGDMLRAIAKWAVRRGVAVKLTGIDLNPFAARAAQEFTAGQETSIEWVTGDAFSYQPEQPIDVVLSSLFTHHLPEAEIVRFLRWMEATAQRGWFINDLRRSAATYYLYRTLSTVARWHRFVRHDGPVSIRRSFREADWQRMLSEAGLQDAATISRVFPGRLCVGRTK